MLTDKDFNPGDWVCRTWKGSRKEKDIFQIKGFIENSSQATYTILTHKDYYRNNTLLENSDNSPVFGINTDSRTIDTKATREDMPLHLQHQILDNTLEILMKSLDDSVEKMERKLNDER